MFQKNVHFFTFLIFTSCAQIQSSQTPTPHPSDHNDETNSPSLTSHSSSRSNSPDSPHTPNSQLITDVKTPGTPTKRNASNNFEKKDLSYSPSSSSSIASAEPRKPVDFSKTLLQEITTVLQVQSTQITSEALMAAAYKEFYTPNDEKKAWILQCLYGKYKLTVPISITFSSDNNCNNSPISYTAHNAIIHPLFWQLNKIEQKIQLAYLARQLNFNIPGLQEVASSTLKNNQASAEEIDHVKSLLGKLPYALYDETIADLAKGAAQKKNLRRAQKYLKYGIPKDGQKRSRSPEPND